MKNFKFICLALALVLTACTSRNGTYAAISDRPMNLYDLTLRKGLVVSGVEAKSSRSIGIIIPNDDTPTIDEALNELLTKYNGDYLANAEVTHTSFHLVWLFHYSAWNVKGDVMKLYK